MQIKAWVHKNEFWLIYIEIEHNKCLIQITTDSILFSFDFQIFGEKLNWFEKKNREILFEQPLVV